MMETPLISQEISQSKTPTLWEKMVDKVHSKNEETDIPISADAIWDNDSEEDEIPVSNSVWDEEEDEEEVSY
jgi:hypothetical protein